MGEYRMSRRLKDYYDKNLKMSAEAYVNRELQRVTFGDYIDTAEIMRIFRITDRIYAGKIRRKLGLKHLSNKTIQVYKYYVDGMPVNMIAKKLNMSERNIYGRLENIRKETGYRNPKLKAYLVDRATQHKERDKNDQ